MGDLLARGRDCVCACGGHGVEAGSALGGNVNVEAAGVVNGSVMVVCGHLHCRRGVGKTF